MTVLMSESTVGIYTQMSGSVNQDVTPVCHCYGMFWSLKPRPHMTIGETFLPEFDREMANTRSMLEGIPEGKLDWSPHARSATLGKLASHIVMIPGFAAMIVYGKGKLSEAQSKTELLALLDANVEAGRSALANVSDEHMLGIVPVAPELSMPRTEILRTRVFSHMIHHRGQLSVYLRLLDLPVPGMYGASADEKNIADRS
jgi:uncharacterized damage-inducible protein DinB